MMTPICMDHHTLSKLGKSRKMTPLMVVRITTLMTTSTPKRKLTIGFRCLMIHMACKHVLIFFRTNQMLPMLPQSAPPQPLHSMTLLTSNTTMPVTPWIMRVILILSFLSFQDPMTLTWNPKMTHVLMMLSLSRTSFPILPDTSTERLPHRPPR